MLNSLPIELLQNILMLLKQHDLCQLGTSNRYLYKLSLPLLYRHIKLGNYMHVRKLQYGVQNNLFLKETIMEHTVSLSLQSTKEGNNWRTKDLFLILGKNSKIATLTFLNHSALSTVTIDHVVSILPQLQHVQLQYCHLVYKELPRYSTFDQQCNKAPTRLHFKQLSLDWTDFTAKSIKHTLYPQITHLHLGSNRNKQHLLNQTMASSIIASCPHITHLAIALPQVTESTLCDLITHYGTQLQQLSMRCDSPRLLHTVSAHATQLTQLSLRISPTAAVSTVAEASDTISDALFMLTTSLVHLSVFEIASCYLERDVPWAFKEIPHIPSPPMKEATVSVPATRRHVWFAGGDVFEELLQQRYYHNLIHGHKQQSNNFKKILIHKDCIKT